ncbi:hypothetical protein CYMTET_30582 [Cymbomonas tetramitiformis]|uniref:Uncharacterized protein n=1 Tax=Cymbomonas tetramitiformis TaxID=36881 RepID=A0AAE0FIU7_9CHLO|nr:hypothetical protein CYMTET_30582 [Cymbomonas tetramitiformis]
MTKFARKPASAGVARRGRWRAGRQASCRKRRRRGASPAAGLRASDAAVSAGGRRDWRAPSAARALPRWRDETRS